MVVMMVIMMVMGMMVIVTCEVHQVLCESVPRYHSILPPDRTGVESAPSDR
jgi:hypothetical protein